MSWAPDGKSVTLGTLDRPVNLRRIDLQNSSERILISDCPVSAWSPAKDGPIAYITIPPEQSNILKNQQIWLMNPDGTNPRFLAHGGSVSWSNDGSVFAFQLGGQHPLGQLIQYSLDGAEPELKFLMPIDGFPSVSRDGSLAASTTYGQLCIRKLKDQAVVRTVALGEEEYGNCDFSPDGRYLAYGSFDTRYPGTWLIDVATGRRKLLANINATRPRWSPDGKTLAADVMETRAGVRWLSSGNQTLFDLGTARSQSSLPLESVTPGAFVMIESPLASRIRVTTTAARGKLPKPAESP